MIQTGIGRIFKVSICTFPTGHNQNADTPDGILPFQLHAPELFNQIVHVYSAMTDTKKTGSHKTEPVNN